MSSDYYTGKNTLYDISGLALNATYYWAVFATNSTGTTWSKIYRFTTSENPPLTAVPQTISFPALPVMTYGDLPVTLTATAPSGLPVTFTSSNTSVATLSGNILTANSTGTADIIAMQTGNGTYAPARYIRILTVNKADQTIPMLQ